MKTRSEELNRLSRLESYAESCAEMQRARAAIISAGFTPVFVSLGWDAYRDTDGAVYMVRDAMCPFVYT